jgi:hypothetical protein
MARPYYPRIANLRDGNKITVDGNNVLIKVLKLSNKSIETRYRLMLNTLKESVEKNILKYNPRVEYPTDKNLTEAMRNRADRDFSVFKYESNIFFEYELGLEIMKQLKESKNIDESDKYPDGVYIRSNKQTEANKQRMIIGKKKINAFIKFYNMKIKHGVNLFKLEITIDSDMIKAQNKSHKKNNDIPDLRKVKTWLDQPNVQQIKSVHKKIKSGITLLLDNLNDEVINQMKEVLGVTNKKDIADKMLDPFYTLKEIEKRLTQVETENQVIREENKTIKENQNKILNHLGLKEDKK